MSLEETKAFLSDERKESNDSEVTTGSEEMFRNPSRPAFIQSRRFLIIVMIVFEIFQISIFYYAATTSWKAQSVLLGDHYTPAAGVLKFESRNIWRMEDDSAFNGPPGLDMDLAWAELEAGTLIKISDDDISKANRSSIPLQGGGWAGALGVSHNLHCLKRLNKMVHMDHYYPNVSSERKGKLIHHGQHCVDALRRNLICYADPTLITLNWERTITGRPGIQADDTQRCINWNSLHAWMVENGARAADLIRPDGSLFDESSLPDS